MNGQSRQVVMWGEWDKRPVVPDIALSYIAGLFDGEGCITLQGNGSKSGKKYVAVIVAMTDKEGIALLNAYFPTRVYKRKPQVDNHLPCYEWRLTGGKAKTFLQAISPYLQVKKAKALNVI